MALRLCQVVPFLFAVGCLFDPARGAMDTGARVSEDAPIADGSEFGDAPAPGTDGGGGVTDFAERDCFDFADDDGDGAGDCADRGCRTSSAICCALGSTEGQCCAAARTVALDPSTCTPGPATCLAAVDAFGAMAVVPAPTACGSRLVLSPAVDPNADSGILAAETLELRVSRSILRFELGRSASDGLGRIGVGLVADGAGARVVPVLAVERTWDRVLARVGEAEVAARSASGCVATVQVTVSPDGSATIAVDGASLWTGRLTLPHRARFVVYGRRDADTAAWAANLVAESDTCARIEPTPASAAAVSGVPRDATLRRVSVARLDPTVPGLAALDIDGRILPGIETATGVTVDALANPLVPVANLDPGGPDWVGGVSDPHLVAEDGRHLLLFAGRDADGTSAIFAMTLDLGLGSPSTPLPVLRSTDAAVMADAIDGPAYFEEASTRILLFRAHTGERTEIRFVTLVDGLFSAVADGVVPAASPGVSLFDGEAPTMGVVAASGLPGFALDEVAEPRALRLPDGIVRVLFAGRRGTRWAVGALASTDFQHFDAVQEGGAVMAPSLPFDALGVRAPEPLVIGPSSAPRLRIYYTGTTGTATTLGVAEQSVPGAAP